MTIHRKNNLDTEKQPDLGRSAQDALSSKVTKCDNKLAIKNANHCAAAFKVFLLKQIMDLTIVISKYISPSLLLNVMTSFYVKQYYFLTNAEGTEGLVGSNSPTYTDTQGNVIRKPRLG